MLYTLTNDKFTATADTMGAELFSLKDKSGTEYLWLGDTNFWSGRSPHLFPIIGSQKNDRYTKDGKTYNIDKHGFARHSDFKVSEKSDTHIVFELTENEDSLKVYPYSFNLKISHYLTDTGIETKYTVENTGDEKLPFCVGGHVGVNCPIFDGEDFNDYVVKYNTEKPLTSLFCPTADPIDFANNYLINLTDGTLKLTHSLFDNDAIVVNDQGVTAVDLVHSKTGHGVHFTFKGFPVIALWTMHGKEAPYLCLEPWHGLPSVKGEGDALEDKAHIIVLDAGNTKELSYQLDII